MSKRMTVIFEDEQLYTALKVEAVRRGVPAKDIVSEAVREWLETREDLELAAEMEEAIREWEREGGIDAEEFFRRWDAERSGYLTDEDGKRLGVILSSREYDTAGRA